MTESIAVNVLLQFFVGIITINTLTTLLCYISNSNCRARISAKPKGSNHHKQTMICRSIRREVAVNCAACINNIEKKQCTKRHILMNSNNLSRKFPYPRFPLCEFLL